MKNCILSFVLLFGFFVLKAQTAVSEQTDPTFRTAVQNENSYNQKLAELRAKIDEADNKILAVLSERMKVADEIGILKKQNNSTAFQNKRWKAVLESRIAEGKKAGLSETFVSKIFNVIHEESVSRQQKLIKSLK